MRSPLGRSSAPCRCSARSTAVGGPRDQPARRLLRPVSCSAHEPKGRLIREQGQPPAAIVASCAIDWNVEEAASAVLLVRVAEHDDQRINDENLTVDGANVEDPGVSRDGTRLIRLHTDGGPVRLRYRATVELANQQPFDPGVALPTFGAVALDRIVWTLPSRYCPSDVLAPTADTLFGHLPRTASLLEAVRSWVESSIAYTAGVSDAHTDAVGTLLARAGVCRDLAHLTIALLRALGVPARMVAAYALDLEPQDFHALVEAHDGVAWRLLDATGLAPTSTIARIATGRDATDIAWATYDGTWELEQLTIEVDR